MLVRYKITDHYRYASIVVNHILSFQSRTIASLLIADDKSLSLGCRGSCWIAGPSHVQRRSVVDFRSHFLRCFSRVKINMAQCDRSLCAGFRNLLCTADFIFPATCLSEQPETVVLEDVAVDNFITNETDHMIIPHSCCSTA